MNDFLDLDFPAPLRAVHLRHRLRVDMALHSHSFWQIIAVTEGTLRITLPHGGALDVPAGSVHIQPPGFAHGLQSDYYTQIGIDLNDVPDERSLIAALRGAFHAPTVCAVPAAEGIDRTLFSLHEIGSPLARAQLMHTVDALLLECAARQTPAALPLISYLDARLTEPLVLRAVAADFFVSVPQLERRCRQSFGCGVMELRARRRLNAAQTLLLEDRSVADIAQAVGFSDPAHFSVFFRRWTGQSPRASRSKSRAVSESGVQNSPAALVQNTDSAGNLSKKFAE